MARTMQATQYTERRRRGRGRQSQPVKLRKFLKVAQEEFARLIGVSVRTVARWESEGVRPNSEIREQLDFLLKLSKRLDEVIDRKHITDWLTTQNPEFLNQPPVDLIQSKYGRRVLEQEIERAEWGIPA